MIRNALDDLVKWNVSKNRKPLIVWGARQVGKTYLIKELFAKQYYNKDYFYIDVNREEDYRNYFNTTCDAEKIIKFIEAKSGKRVNNKTLLIFDEIQECPNLVTALKYFCQDFKDIPVIVTGSMVRTKLRSDSKKEQEILFPVGKINELTLYPLTFDEYLINANSFLYEKVYTAYCNGDGLEDAYHKLTLDYFYKYLLIGGMPEAVDYYLSSDDILETKNIIKVLYNNYINDMALYQISEESLLRTIDIYKNIYKQLNKESKNFSPSLINAKFKNRDLYSPIEWLKLAHIVNKSSQLKEHITLPLTNEDNSNYRLYLCDMGLFTFESGENAANFIDTTNNTLSGIFYENYVANELTAKDINLYYWRGKRSNELEFITQYKQSIVPFDVKKGRGALNSLEEFSYHNKYEFIVKVCKNNYGYSKDNKILTIPFYFMPFIAKDISRNNIIKLIKN